MTAATVSGLSFTYGGATGAALDGVDVDVEAGRVLLLRGRPGRASPRSCGRSAGWCPTSTAGASPGA